MDKFFSFIGDNKDPRLGGADSFCDRLNCCHTVLVLVVFASMITAKHYIGDPISCWCPSDFTGPHCDYTNKVCWTTNTYYLPFSDRIPKDKSLPKDGQIGYYQWVALILLFQAALFYIPRPVWRILNKKSGIALATITDAAIEYQKKMDAEDRDKTMRYMVKHIGRYLLDLNRSFLMANRFKRFWLNIYGNYLLIAYIFVKLIYVGNVLIQIYFLNLFLGMDYHMYGFKVMRRMFDGQDWSTSDRFPRVTMCDFKIRVLGNIHPYTVQCALPMNLFNEIIFIFIWFWYVFVLIATAGSLVIWISTSIYMPWHIKSIKCRLIAVDKIKASDTKKALGRFVTIYLRRDGCFILKMVVKNASDMVAAELLGGLWDHYKDNIKSVEKLSAKDVRILECEETANLNPDNHVHVEVVEKGAS